MRGTSDFSAIILAAGKGLRMGGDIKKQFLLIHDKPLIYYTIKAFEESSVSEIILVCPQDDLDYVKTEITDHYGFKKITATVAGGDERYLSVYEGLKKVNKANVLIHDGARCCITSDVITDMMDAVITYKAAVAAVPSTDTVKLADDDGFVSYTPRRDMVWSMQTPQGFNSALIKEAYDRLFSSGDTERITDDALVLERAMPEQKIKLIKSSYDNIKITTKKDLLLAERLL